MVVECLSVWRTRNPQAAEYILRKVVTDWFFELEVNGVVEYIDNAGNYNGFFEMPLLKNSTLSNIIWTARVWERPLLRRFNWVHLLCVSTFFLKLPSSMFSLLQNCMREKCKDWNLMEQLLNRNTEGPNSFKLIPTCVQQFSHSKTIRISARTQIQATH